MAARARRWWNILGKILDALMDFVDEKIPEETKLRDDMSKMLEVLNLKADAAGFAMALADEKYRKLAMEVMNYENLEKQARGFLMVSDETKAYRCVALKIQSKQQIEKLGVEYQGLQKEAESKAKDFKFYQETVNVKRTELVRLSEDLRLIRAQEEIEKKEKKFSYEEAERSFDEKAREIELKKLQLQNKALITADPNTETDKEIRQAVQEQDVEAAFNCLKKEVCEQKQLEEGVVDAEFLSLNLNPLFLAKKMLEAPRFGETKKDKFELKQLSEIKMEEEK